MPGVALSPSTRASSATRSIVHLPPHRSGIYSSRQSPLLPPPARKTDLPISSPLDQLSSPAKHQPDLNTGDMPIAGPSRPKPVPAQPINLSDDEDEFDGIEDVVPTQAEPTTGKSMTTGEHARVTLDDLFESSSDSVKGVEDEVDKEYEKAFGRSDGESGKSYETPFRWTHDQILKKAAVSSTFLHLPFHANLSSAPLVNTCNRTRHLRRCPKHPTRTT